MIKGVELPAGEWATDRSVERFRRPKRLGLAMTSLMFVLSPIDSAEPDPELVEEPTFCEKMGSLCLIAESLSTDMPVIADTPGEAIVAAVTTTTIPTTTTTKPPMSCGKVKQYFMTELPPAPGWRILCAPSGFMCPVGEGENEKKVVCDGYSIYGEKTILLSFEDNDSTRRRMHTAAHEIKHSRQAARGDWTGEVEPHNAPELEREADAFAETHGFPDDK